MADKKEVFENNINKQCTTVSEGYKSLSEIAKTDPALLKKIMSEDFGIEVWLDKNQTVAGYVEKKAFGRQSYIEDPNLDKMIDSIANYKLNKCIISR